MSQELNEKLKSIFAVEALDQINSLDQSLLSLEKNYKNEQPVNLVLEEIFRTVHTLKASTSAFDYHNLTSYLHQFESFLDLLRSGTITLDQDLIFLIYTILGIVNKDINHVLAHHQDVEPRDNENSISRLKDLVQGLSDTSLDAQAPRGAISENQKFYQIIIRPFSGVLKNGFDPLILFQDMKEVGEIIQNTCQTEGVPSFADYIFDDLYLTWEVILKTKKPIEDIKNIFLFIIHLSQIEIDDVTKRYSEEGYEKLLADKRIGKILSDRGLVSEDVVGHAALKQPRIGELLVQDGVVSKEDLDKALADQELARKNVSNTVRVDILKLDSLLNLVGELVISESRLKTIAATIPQREVQRDIVLRCEELSRLIGDLQDKVMNTRMVPVDTLFSQFHRMVRDLSQSQQKVVRLSLVGQETELDKNIIEKISSPLKHLVRNSIDHGIENPEERVASGKSREALVTLKAYQKEGGVFLEVSDDGKGLDREAIIKKAVEKGLISKDEKIEDEHVYSLIFLPGFSTAKKITDVSGRGVGMDVVKKSVEELKGQIKINTIAGKGTSFIIRLPLTLAIIEGLLFRVGSQQFAIPLLAIESTLRPIRKNILTIEGKGECVVVQGKSSVLLRLHRLFKIQDAEEDPTKAILLNVTIYGRSYSLMIDDVIGQQQVVIKNLEKNFRKVKGFSGATILGDGAVASIIDPEETVEFYRQGFNF